MRLLKQIRRYKLVGLTVLFSLLTVLTGCSRLTIYPIRDTDIRVDGDKVIMSKWYYENVLKVKLEEGR